MISKRDKTKILKKKTLHPMDARNQYDRAKKPFMGELGDETTDMAHRDTPSWTDTGSGYIPFNASVKSPKKQAVFVQPLMEVHKNDSKEVGMGEVGNTDEVQRGTSRETRKYKNLVQNYSDNEKMPDILRKDEDKTLDTSETGEVDLIKKKEGSFTMKKLEKFAEDRKKIQDNREKRIESIYKMEEDYAAYGRYCAKNTCVGVWKELLGYDAKKDLGIERVSEVWKCPSCGEVTSAHGSISEQTSGFSAWNTQAPNKDVKPPVIKEDKDRTKR